MRSLSSSLDLSWLTDKVSILKVEAIKLVTSLFRIYYIFVDHEGCTLGVVGHALSDLSILHQPLETSTALDTPRRTL